MNLFSSYTGADFLVFYGLMLATCVFLALWIPANLRPPGRRGLVEDMEELAVLAGGRQRHVDAVLTDLMARDALVESGSGTLAVHQQEIATGSAGRAILRTLGDFNLRGARRSIEDDADAIEARLIERGLMMDRGERTKLRWLSILPYIALFAIGLYRQRAGAALGEPTALLIVLLGVTTLFALLRFVRINPRTMAGNAVLRDLEKERSRMRRAPQANEAGYAVALFGTGVLVGTPWEPVHAMRQSDGGGGGYAGGSDSDGGGGGGCGGGCGGCGG